MGLNVGSLGVLELLQFGCLLSLDVVVVDECVGFAVARIGGVNPGVAVFSSLDRDEGSVFVVPGKLEALRSHLLGLSLLGGGDDFADVGAVALKYLTNS